MVIHSRAWSVHGIRPLLIHWDSVLAVFAYYATRPICRQLARVVDSNRVAAGLTILLLMAPIVLLIVFTEYRLATAGRHRHDHSKPLASLSRCLRRHSALGAKPLVELLADLF